MSKEIDNRVVKMEFDNSNFESKAKQSLSTLSKLEEALKLKGAGDGLDGLKSSVSNLDLTNIASAAELISNRFSTLGIIGMTALQNITNAAIRTGTQLVKSLSVEQIMAGYGEYELKLGSVNTIMASTGESIETVSGYLEQLNEYADKTIYSFSDMTSNIGKFTNAGVELDTAVAAMKGISNWAAVAGANANEASRAMYNISQSLAGGYIQLLDWKSVKFANMATQDVMKNMVEVAKVMGTIKENSDGTFDSITKNTQSKKAEALTLQQLFNEGLNYQWLSNDVFMKAMELYSTDVREMDEATLKSYRTKLKYVNASKEQMAQILSMNEAEAEAFAKKEKIKAGFTEAQIDGFIELSKKANESATVVKSFSQMMDTLKEGIGSSWAMTFEYLFGNLEQSKKLWSGILKEIEAVTGPIGDARNEMAKGWSELGGREMLISGISNLWQVMVKHVRAVAEAFKEIFPRKSIGDLVVLTGSFDLFAKKLNKATNNLDDIKTLFKGIFSGAQIVIKSFKSLTVLVKTILGNFSGVGNSIKTLFLEAAKYVTNFNETFNGFDETATKIGTSINKVLNIFSGFAKFVIDEIKNIFKWLNEGEKVIDIIPQVIRDISGEVVTLVGNLLGIDTGKINDFVAKMWTYETKIHDGLVKIFDIVKKTFSGKELELGKPTIAFENLTKIFNYFYDGLKQLVAALKPFGDELKKNFKEVFGNDLNLSNVIKMILDGSMIVGIADMVTRLKNVLDPLDDIGDMITNIREDLSIAFKGLNAKYLKSIATSVIMLAGALLLVSLIDPERLTGALMSITVMMGEMAGMLKVIQTMKLDAIMKLSTIGSMFIKMGASILLLAVALKVISSIDQDALGRSMLAITGLMAELLVVMKLMDKLKIKKVTKNMTQLIFLAAAMLILASAVKKLGEIDSAALIKGVTALGVVLLELGIFTQMTNRQKINGKTAMSLLIISAALLVLTQAAEKFGSMNWEVLGKAGAAFGSILLIYAGFMALERFGKPSISGALGLVLIAAAMNLIIKPAKELGEMNWEALGKAGAALLGLLALVAVFSLFTAGANLALASIGLVLMAAALNIMVPPIEKLAAINWKSLAKAGLFLAGLLTIVGLFALTGPSMILAGVGILAFAAGLNVLMVPLLALSKMKMGTILKLGLSMITLSLSLTLAAAILTLISPLLVIAGAALHFFGTSLLMASAGFALCGAAMSVFAVGLGAFVATGIPAVADFGKAMVAMIVTVVEALPTIIKKLGATIHAICKLLIDNIPMLLKVLGALLTEVFKFIIDKLPEFFIFLTDFWAQVMLFMLNAIPQLVAFIVDMVTAILNTLAEHIPDMITAAVNFVIAFCKGIIDNLNQIIDAAFEIVVALIEGLAVAVDKNGPELVEAIKHFIEAIWHTVEKLFDSIVDIGLEIVEGIVLGIYNNVYKVVDAAMNLCTSIWDTIVDFFTIASPSKKMMEIGKFVDLGFAKGIDNNSDTVVNTAESMAKKTSDAIESSFSRIMDDNSGFNPVITPSLNLTQLRRDAGTIGSLFEKKTINGQLSANGVTNQNGVAGNGMTFVQNNYSPKALSRTEIYRQTKNQFAALGGA